MIHKYRDHIAIVVFSAVTMVLLRLAIDLVEAVKP